MHTFSVGRGRRRKKLPWVPREHTDITSSIREYVELQVDFLLSLHLRVFKKNGRVLARPGQRYPKTMKTSREYQDPRMSVRLLWKGIAADVEVPMGRGKLRWRV